MKKTIIQYFSMVFAFVVLLTVAYAIPNSALESKAEHSVYTITEEKPYRLINPEDYGSRLDNSTDRLMINTALKGNSNALYEAMDNSNYARYWHGYQVFLRPLLVFISYSSIRQLYGFVLVILIGLVFYLLTKKLDVFIGLSFLMSLMFVRFYTFFLSMQFSNIFIVLFIGLIYLLTRETKYFIKEYFVGFFFLIGAVTNFIDLLTAPLITLGAPMIIIYYLKAKDEKLSLIELLKQLVGNSFFWGLGYGITWLLKWTIASVVLQKNIISDAITQILFRTEGDESWPISRPYMLRINFELMFNKLNLLVIGLIVVALVCFLFMKRKTIKRGINLYLLGILSIGMMPYVWYLTLANHSQIHFWFTYRLQFVTVFALLSVFSFIVSNRCKNSLIENQ
ncbi:hypothetical protein VXN63_03870 [Marinilactibacillus sp. XAAS-LB27]|uniref:hypothetical protein n=1 Tax=Marinilactibacillus sp. XAAS-LB27 TaxID=3114538 RepID=UPI002E1846FF|nr:hypothetical protein [Marinilactibacillus sp. XAAS-LB27]